MPTKRAEKALAQKRAKELYEAIRFLRDAQSYIGHAVESIQRGDRKAPRQCMQRVRECLTEASRELRGK